MNVHWTRRATRKLLLSFCFGLFSPLALAQYQVCSLTINSSDEIEMFRHFLPQEDFQFVELVPANEEGQALDHSAHWFDSVCQQDHKCDILVVSGHFGGLFFGKSGFSLPLEILEEKACRNICQGLLSGVKEIFLFGCNTLADKTKDSRTYREYLQVLLDDGMARETAEQVVAARYSPLGTPFHARMNFIFNDSGAIYGFDELSPLGPNARAPLENYFQAIGQKFGSYTAYLRAEGWKRERNQELLAAFSHTSLNQARISLDDESQQQRLFFNNKCLLYDDTKPFAERVRALPAIFSTGRAGAAFFAMERFLNQNEKQVIEGAGRHIFRSLRGNSAYKREFLSYYPHLDFLPYIQLVYLSVLERFRWIKPVDLTVLRKQALMEMIAPADMSAYISLLLLLNNSRLQPQSVYISQQDLPQDYFRDIWGLLIFEKLKADAPNWQTDIMKHCRQGLDDTPALCYQALNTLAHIQPVEKTVPDITGFLDHSDPHLHYYSIRALGQSALQDCSVHNKISLFLSDPDPSIRIEAIEALGFLQSPCKLAQENLARLLPSAGEDTAKRILWSFGRMNINSPQAEQAVVRYGAKNTGREERIRLVFSALEGLSSFSDSTLLFFYHYLESRDNEDLLLFVVESLSRNPHLRDEGIYLRFLLFQDAPVRLKREALKRMTFLTWLDPTVQARFLDWLRDKDLEVRVLAVRVLRNIQNLQPEILIQWRDLCAKDDSVRPLCGGLRFHTAPPVAT